MMIRPSRTTRTAARYLYTLVLIAAIWMLALPNAQAQSLISTVDLRQLVGNPKGLVGIQYNREVGLEFQKGVLHHLAGLKFAYQTRVSPF